MEELHINIEENQNKARDKSRAPTLVSSLRCAIPITMFLEAQEIDNLVAAAVCTWLHQPGPSAAHVVAPPDCCAQAAALPCQCKFSLISKAESK